MIDLLKQLAIPDPDEAAYTALVESFPPADPDVVFDHVVARLGVGPVWESSFLSLVLADLCAHGLHSPTAFDAFAAWWPTEADTTGFDPELGWVHAVAHGADYVAAAPVPATVKLSLIAQRLAGPGGVYTAHEDARLARAINLALEEEPSTDWLEPLTELDPNSPQGQNTATTLSAACAARPDPHLSEVLKRLRPYLW